MNSSVCNSRPDTGSLNLMAIESAVSQSRQSTVFWGFPCDQPGGTSSLTGGERKSLDCSSYRRKPLVRRRNALIASRNLRVLNVTVPRLRM